MGMLLSGDFIEDVRSRNDIVDIISEYVHLKPSGKGYFGLCPFHSEKTPSFHVSPDKQVYYCFGCSMGGNVFTFIMAMEKLDFPESVKYLAEKAGMELPDTIDSKEFAMQKDKRDKLHQLNREAARYYRKMLFSPQAGQALSYLKNRGLDDRTIKIFGLGFAPEGWDNIKQLLLGMGYEEELLVQSGIIVENKGRTYDRFRNRIMFPIIRPGGYVIGFGGRVIDDSLPKYLNSTDSPVFNKSSTLYGLNLVKRGQLLEYMIITEGYMDVITLYQYGFKNTVASLGTALTHQQARLLRRYTGEVYIAYDGDKSGQQATLRGLDMLQNAGLRVKVISFPEGMDPDQTLREYGSRYFKELMDSALSLIDYKLDQLRKQYNLDTLEGRTDYATEAAKILTKVPNLLERDAHIKRLEAQTGFSSRLLYRQIEQIEALNRQDSVKKRVVGNNRYIGRKGVSLEVLPVNIKAERNLAALMATDETYAKKIIGRISREYFEEPINGEIYDIVSGFMKDGTEISIPRVLSCVQDQSKIRQMVEIFEQQVEYDNIDKFISDCLKEVICNRLEKRRQEVKALIEQIEKEGHQGTERYNALMNEMVAIIQKISMNRQGKEGIL
ncbi:MAG: DNA primase [Clostridiales bacterium]|jgi:DNA primase|nr:DNA primase [Clostridiales bacterium]